MRPRASAFAAVALVALSVCAAAASCGLDTSGQEAATNDGSTKPTSDARVSKDGPGGGTDSPAREGQVDAPADVSTNDAPITPDVQPGDDGPSEDSPSLVDVSSDGPPTCTGCAANQCCNDKGMCTNAGNKTCGSLGETCVDCTNSPLGNQCVVIGGVQTCGCAGPGNQNQCPMNDACHNNQCGTSCDGQHPCNGGCCSGNDLATSTCVTACTSGMMCMMNYCQ